MLNIYIPEQYFPVFKEENINSIFALDILMHRQHRDMKGVTKELLAWEALTRCKRCRLPLKIGQARQLPFEAMKKELAPDRWVKLCPMCNTVYPEPVKVRQRGLADWKE